MSTYLDRFSMKGKVAFVAGGAGLIGAEVSRAFSSSGALTVILDIDKKKGDLLAGKIRKQGHKAYFEAFDISQIDRIGENIDKLVDKYGKADVWVNAAYPRTKDWGISLDRLEPSSWRQNIDMHLNGYFFCSFKVAERMKAQKYGSIINLASIYGIVGPDFSLYEGTDMNMPAEYSAIKGGIINFSKYLSSRYGKYNIRVNTVSPGGVLDKQPGTFVKRYEKKVPLGRMASKEDIAGAVLFMASHASSYITGHNLVVDGGFSII